ncbi:MAG: CinA family nicotinamide mononucleotide deamidase-related protein [Actinomycetota bacterium]
MIAEVVAVGSELLLGQITNSNARTIYEALASAGADVAWHTAVGDDLERLTAVLRLALSRAEVVVICGGLGPTHDDLTREGIAAATGRALERRSELVAALEERFARMGRRMAGSNLRQAELPLGAQTIPNPAGTAPGVYLEHEGRRLYALPGVPLELAGMLEGFVVPSVRHATGGAPLRTRVLRTSGITESELAGRIAWAVERVAPGGAGHPRLAILASEGEVRLTLTAPEGSPADAEAGELAAAMAADLGTLVYGDASATLAGVVLSGLRSRGLSLAVAESLTGGMLASRLVDVPGASATLVAGYVAYSAEAKMRDLAVPAETIRQHGLVSEETARAMAVGARERAGASVALSTTGEAGPLPAEAEVGTVCIGIAWEGGTALEAGATAWTGRMPGTRALIRSRTATSALNRLRLWLLEQPGPGAGG